MTEVRETFPGAEIYGEAHAHHYETFLERAAHEPDPDFAEDLRFAAQIATELGEADGLALAVGGYARDSALAKLNGKPVDSKDIDMEVYGVEFDNLAEILEAHGKLDLVGASFGIAKVKNPVTGHELDFSIPREDSKVDKGHRGFEVTGDPNMTVEEAARRRDLTINALAINPLTGELIDHYGGLDDLENGVLRATDPELFKDDPLRVLRVMQFAGRFEFVVDPETFEICRSLDLSELPESRIGDEWTKLMKKSERPSIGMQVARDLEVFEQLHPLLAELYSPDQDPDGKTWEHTKEAVDAAAQITRDEGLSLEEKIILLFGTLSLDLGRSRGHETVRDFLDGLAINRDPQVDTKLVKKIVPLVRYAVDADHGPQSNKEIRQLAVKLKPVSIRMWDLVSRADANGWAGTLNEKSASHTVYEQALALDVAESPMPAIVQGRDLIERLSMKQGPHFREILDFLYDAQLGDEFTTLEEGIAYFQTQNPDLV